MLALLVVWSLAVWEIFGHPGVLLGLYWTVLLRSPHTPPIEPAKAMSLPIAKEFRKRLFSTQQQKYKMVGYDAIL